jgi:hypothetical protein
VYDDELLQIDCPDLGASGKVISIIGNLGESFGVLVFDSVEAFEALAEHGEVVERGRRPKRLRTSIFSINFERGADIPKSMRAEIAIGNAHGGGPAARRRRFVSQRRAIAPRRPIMDLDELRGPTGPQRRHAACYDSGSCASRRSCPWSFLEPARPRRW